MSKPVDEQGSEAGPDTDLGEKPAKKRAKNTVTSRPKGVPALHIFGGEATIKQMPVSKLVNQPHESWAARAERFESMRNKRDLFRVVREIEAASLPLPPSIVAKLPIVQARGAHPPYIIAGSDLIMSADKLHVDSLYVIQAKKESAHEVVKRQVSLQSKLKAGNVDDDDYAEMNFLHSAYS